MTTIARAALAIEVTALQTIEVLTRAKLVGDGFLQSVSVMRCSA
jgi:hypothetical protein